MSEENNTSIETADVLAIDKVVSRSSGSAQFGITKEGFVPKSFARLLAEKLALARELFGTDLDLTSGSAIRKLLEISALEDTRTWAALSAMYDNNFVVSATGDALTRLGTELGYPRPYLEARGKIKFKLTPGNLSAEENLTIPRGARLHTPGGYHVATTESARLSLDNVEREVSVVAFYPGPGHDLNPGIPEQKINNFNDLDPSLNGLMAKLNELSADIQIDHTQNLSGGKMQWPDDRYRQLILDAPRSIWSVDAIRIAVSLVPGVRQVQIQDAFGGLDIYQSIFGNFNFIERLFNSERDLGSPYYFTVLVAKTDGAIWGGMDGLKVSIENAIEDLRPISIFPRIEQAVEVGVGVQANLIIKGLPLPSGTTQTINESKAATALKNNIMKRLNHYVESLQLGQPVRQSEFVWSIMNEPGIVDVQDLQLIKYPPDFDALDFDTVSGTNEPQILESGKNVDVKLNEIAVFVDDSSKLNIV